MASNDVLSWFQACTASYFEHLHHYWPFLHAPTFDLEAEPLMTSASLVVLGSWCRDPLESESLRLELHERLLKWHVESLGDQIRPEALDASQAWEVGGYQAALLSVLFEIYHVSRVPPRSRSPNSRARAEAGQYRTRELHPRHDCDGHPSPRNA